MDTKNLVVGQYVWLFGIGYVPGKVVAVTPSGIDVQGDVDLLSFDNNGVETDDSRRRRLTIRPGAPIPKGPGLEYMPWVIDETRNDEAIKLGFGLPVSSKE
jgi:hypothetical protein